MMVNNMFALKFCGILWYLSTLATCYPGKTKETCGYESCHPIKEGFVNVHIVPHTHDDVGWLKTVEQYYYGSMNYIQNAAVSNILDSVVDSLGKNKDRRFIYVETAFLSKWWSEQHDAQRHKLKGLIKSGQLEIIGGAWSMNDEATTHYQSIIDQFTWGLRILNDTFGECGRPKIGWQIDPFGHSREMASILAQLGYDGLLLGRIDYQDKDNRFTTKTPEFIWQASDNLGDKAKLFTSVMYNTYAPPPGFCFDILCSDEPIIDDKSSAAYNVPQRVEAFFKYLNNVTKAYSTQNIIITMGEDFNYQYAENWFKSLDKLILYGNEQEKNGSRYHLLYSTPSCYLKAVQDEKKNNRNAWTVKTDDFFPYASDPHAYWTGYFTSRPTLKRYERLGNNFLQVCKQLYALADLSLDKKSKLDALREAMGIMQHHDAITGTEKQHVAYDYARTLSNGFDKCQKVVSAALSKIITKATNKKPYKNKLVFKSCLLANVSECAITETFEKFTVTVYNPLSRNVSHYVRLPVTGKAYEVKNYAGYSVPVQLISTPDTIKNIPGRNSNSGTELIFLAKDIPPLGFLSYFVTEIPGDYRIKPTIPKKSKLGIKDSAEISFNPETGKLTEINVGGERIEVSQDFFYYEGAVGDNIGPNARSSGAYIFRPNGTEPIQISETATYKVVEGPLVAELHQVFSNWTSQIIRVFSEEEYVEFDWLVGPIPNDNSSGKEIITRYITKLKTNSTFYTDSNGREILKRVRNYRPTWDLDLNEPVAGNYYPITSKISMRGKAENIEIAVLTDRAQGGSSLNDGELEVMLHRNCKHDDAFGVGEELDESAFGKGLVARGSHYVLAGSYINKANKGKTLAAKQRDVAQRKLLQAWTFVTVPQSKDVEEYRSEYKMRYSGLTRSLPDNVQILTLEPWREDLLLLRLEHVLEKSEDPELSKSVVVNLKDLFTSFTITWYNETTLGGNQWLHDNYKTKLENSKISLTKHKSHSKVHSGESNDINNPYWRQHFGDELNNLDFDIKLNPMQIRTFIIEIAPKNKNKI